MSPTYPSPPSLLCTAATSHPQLTAPSPSPPAQRLLHRLPRLLRALQDSPGQGPMAPYLPYVSQDSNAARVIRSEPGRATPSAGDAMRSLQVWAMGGWEGATTLCSVNWLRHLHAPLRPSDPLNPAMHSCVHTVA